MRTPAGKDCRHYYEDFHRGRNRQECRLIGRNRHSLSWQPSDCSKCPVPDILWANASENLHLEARIKTGFLGFGRSVEIKASCLEHHIEIDDPMIGCPQCRAEQADISLFFTGEGDE